MSGKGKHPTNLANLKKGQGHLAKDPRGFQLKSAAVQKQKATIRRALVAAIETGFMTIESKDVELLDEKGQVIKVDFAKARMKVPNNQAVAAMILAEVMKKNPKFTEIAINLQENYKNRELKAKEKTADAAQSMAEWFNGVKVEKPLEIPITPYEELNRSPE